MKMLLSDNNSGVHPSILEAIYECNIGHEPSYGADKYTRRAIELIREIFHKDVDVYFVTTGTAANIVGLAGILAPYEGVVAPDTAHINVDECGALERFGGAKILYVPNRDGKIYPEDVEVFLTSLGDEHQVQPKIISISQISELGTAYTVEEIRELANFAHDNNMLIHMDGARIANAVVALDSSFKEMVTDTGVDLLSFGGTKNGMMMGEAIISFNKDISRAFKYVRKQAMQLVSKMRFISAQFIPYLEQGIWRENAINSNGMAQYLKKKLSNISGVRVDNKTSGNMLFVQIPKEWNQPLREKYPVYIVDKESNIIRLVTSFDTTEKDANAFVEYIEGISMGK
ncbi:MAG TPA: aminotransferase class I/II-fold pyridoxal phosphate-dependent enzyme [Tepidimicrobium sp.]|nr:aminotransferase class I/II-fold pyridoxal phosphate-dependent enzyme [Tepidimicrobium sp.]